MPEKRLKLTVEPAESNQVNLQVTWVNEALTRQRPHTLLSSHLVVSPLLKNSWGERGSASHGSLDTASPGLWASRVALLPLPKWFISDVQSTLYFAQVSCCQAYFPNGGLGLSGESMAVSS